MDPKWKRFERLAFEIQKELAGDSVVKLDDSIRGFDSQTDRQVDITIRKSVGQYRLLVAIDCKDYKRPIDVKVVEEFAGLLKDIRANKGSLISASGFSKAALNLAERRGIDTFRLVDTESIDWRAYASIPVVLHGRGIGSFQLQFSGIEAPLGIPSNTDFSNVKVISDEGVSLGTLRSLLAQHWNELGEHDLPDVIELELGKGIWLEQAGRSFRADVTAVVQVTRMYYSGPLPVHLRGLENAQTGGVLTRQLTTDTLSPWRIEQGLEEGWQQIEDPEEHSVRPVLEIAYRDLFQRPMVGTILNS